MKKKTITKFFTVFFACRKKYRPLIPTQGHHIREECLPCVNTYGSGLNVL